MNGLLITVVTLLALASATFGISCYYGTSTIISSLSTSTTCDVCYSYSLLGVTTKVCGGTGSGSISCSTSNSYSSYSSYYCCSTSYCNGAKMNGANILMATAAAMIALFRAM